MRLPWADVQVLVQKQKRDFFEQEAAMYYEVYQEVMAAVAAYSKPRGINFVMRFNADPYDPSDPQALQKELNKAVLYHDGIDITDDIIAILSAKSGKDDVAAKGSEAKSDGNQRK